MSHVGKRLRQIDLFVLDRGYSPIANLAHDWLNVRSRQIGFFCMTWMGSAILFENSFLMACVAATVFGCITLTEIYVIGDNSRIGCDNIRRFKDTPIRALWWICVVVDLQEPHRLLWSFGYLSALYFFAVREQPRKPRQVFATQAIAQVST